MDTAENDRTDQTSSPNRLKWGVAGTAILLLCLWLYSDGTGQGEVISYFGTDTIAVIETGSLADLAKTLAQPPFWQRPVERNFAHAVTEHFAAILGGFAFRDLVDVAPSVKRLAYGLVATPMGDPTWLIAAELHDTEMLDQFCDDYQAVDVNVRETKLRRIHAPGGNFLFLALRGNVIILSPDSGVLDTALGVATSGQSLSLPQSDSARHMLARGAFRPAKLSSVHENASRTWFSDWLPFFGAETKGPMAQLRAELSPDAVVTFAAQSRDGEIETRWQTHSIITTAPTASGTGFFSWIFRCIFYVVLTVLLIPVALVAVMLVLALIMYLRMWRKGELHPANLPEPMEELPANLAEDLRSTRRIARRRRRGTTADGDNVDAAGNTGAEEGDHA